MNTSQNKQAVSTRKGAHILRALLFSLLLLGAGACNQSPLPLLADMTVYNSDSLTVSAEVGEAAAASWRVVNDSGVPQSFEPSSSEAWLGLAPVPEALEPGEGLELGLSAYCAAPGRYHAAVVLLSGGEPQNSLAVTLDCLTPATVAVDDGADEAVDRGAGDGVSGDGVSNDGVSGDESNGEEERRVEDGGPFVTSPGELVRPYPGEAEGGETDAEIGEAPADAPQPRLGLGLP